jgi:hypothetical protein
LDIFRKKYGKKYEIYFTREEFVVELSGGLIGWVEAVEIDQYESFWGRSNV